MNIFHEKLLQEMSDGIVIHEHIVDEFKIVCATLHLVYKSFELQIQDQ